MIFRFVSESISRAPKRKALIVAAIAMGSAVATAMLGVMVDIGDKINRELPDAKARDAYQANTGGSTVNLRDPDGFFVQISSRDGR